MAQKIVVERIVGVGADGRFRTEAMPEDREGNVDIKPGEFVQMSRGRQTKLFQAVENDLLPTCAACIRAQLATAHNAGDEPAG